MESQLEPVIRLLAENGWPFRLHATYDESINRALNVYEKVNKEIPINKLNWFFDHAETVTDANLERIKALNGGIAIQHRMAYQGEYFIDRYGTAQTKRSPPIRKMLEMNIPVGAGTDATRVASYNPWICLYWLVAGKTLGGTSLYDSDNTLERLEALKLYTIGSAGLSREADKKGMLSAGMYADMAVLSEDYFAVQDAAIKDITSYLTVLGGKVVYGVKEFAHLDQNKNLPVSPDWSPVGHYGAEFQQRLHKMPLDCHLGNSCKDHQSSNPWSFGCDCFAF